MFLEVACPTLKPQLCVPPMFFKDACEVRKGGYCRQWQRQEDPAQGQEQN